MPLARDQQVPVFQMLILFESNLCCIAVFLGKKNQLFYTTNTLLKLWDQKSFENSPANLHRMDYLWKDLLMAIDQKNKSLKFQI